MNRHALLLLAGALLCARTASAQDMLQRCEKPMADAAQIAQTAADCADARRLVATPPPVAGPAATFEKIEYSTSPMPADVELATRSKLFAGHLQDYFVYTAFAAGNLSLCAPMDQGASTSRECRQNVGKLIFRSAFPAPTAEFVKACIRSEAEVADAQTAKCCEMTAEVRGRPEACGPLAAKCATDVASCRAFAASTRGDSGPCKNLPLETEGCNPKIAGDCQKYQAGEIAKCEGAAVYARAAKAKDISLCGSLRECRVLMGEGKAVAAEIAAKHLRNPAGEWFLNSGWKKPARVAVKRVPVTEPAVAKAGAPKVPAAFKGFVCGEVMATADNRRAVTAAIDAARLCLKDVEAALQNPPQEVVSGIDARAEKLVRMSIRVEKLFGEAAAVKSPKAPAAR